MVLDFLAVDNFDFTRKIVKKKKKLVKYVLVKMLGFCQTWNFGQKFDFSNSVILIDLRLGLYAVVEREHRDHTINRQ